MAAVFGEVVEELCMLRSKSRRRGTNGTWSSRVMVAGGERQLVERVNEVVRVWVWSWTGCGGRSEKAWGCGTAGARRVCSGPGCEVEASWSLRGTGLPTSAAVWVPAEKVAFRTSRASWFTLITLHSWVSLLSTRHYETARTLILLFLH